MSYTPLKFEPFHSSVDADFWHELEHRKLVTYKLDNSPKPIQATYVTGGQYTQLSSRIHVSRDAFIDQNKEQM